MKDKLDVQIATLLADDGRMPNAEIARRLNVAESTIRQRIKRLVDSCGLKITGHMDQGRFPDTFLVLVGITLDVVTETCFEQVAALPNVLYAFTVTGRYDIMAIFAVKSRKALTEVIESQLHKIEGLNRTETFVVMKNEGMMIPSDTFCEMMEIAGVNGADD